MSEGDENENKNSPDADADDSSDHVITTQHAVPEGGWGWFVVLGSFIAHLIIGGLMRTGGVVFLRLEEKFAQTAADTAWAVSLHVTIRLLMAPVASALCNRFSCRFAVLLGGLITAVGVLISGFSPNLWFLYFSYGLLSGFGQALIYTASVVVVGLYFHRRRGTAVGIANAGIGAGTFIFPPLVKILFEEYGFLGAFIIMCGATLNFCVCGALYRSIDTHETIMKNEDIQIQEMNFTEMESKRSDIPLSRDDLRALSMVSLGYDIHISSKYLDQNSNLDLNGSKLSQLHHLSKQVHKYGNERKNNVSSETKLLHVPDVRTRSGSDVTVSQRPRDKELTALSDSIKSLPNPNSKRLYDQDHPKYKPIAQSPLARVSNKNGNYTCSNTEDEDETDQATRPRKRKLLDLGPLKDIRFATLCIGICFYTLSFQSSFVFLPPLSAQKGLKEIEGAYLVSIAGALETLGSVTSGMIIDIDCVNPYILEIYTVANSVLGICTIIIPYLSSFVPLAFVCGIYGYILGGCLAQKAILVVKITGLDRLVSAFGILVGFQGFGTLAGPPLAGFLKDLSGRYDDGFFLGGALLLGAGAIQGAGLLIYAVKNKRNN